MQGFVFLFQQTHYGNNFIKGDSTKKACEELWEELFKGK